MCPTCQSIVNKTQIKEQITTKEEPSPSKKLVTCAHPIASEQAKWEETKVKEPTASHPPEAIKEYAQADENALSQKPKELEQAQNREPNVAEPFPNQQSTIRYETTLPSSPKCEYGFGYLNQREKGTEIPETCTTCPRALDCMLSEYYKSVETVQEIKKWYQR